MGEETEPTQTARKTSEPWCIYMNSENTAHYWSLSYFPTRMEHELPHLAASSPEKTERMGKIERGDRRILEELLNTCYSELFFVLLPTPANGPEYGPQMPFCRWKEILLHENLQTRHSCQNSGHGRRSKRGEGNEAKVDKKNFGNSILPMNEFFVSLQTPVKWFINNMVPDSRRSTTESRFYCTKKTHKPTILVKNKVTKTNQKRACEEGEIDGAEIQKKNLRNPERSREPWNFQIRTYHTWPRTRIILQLTTNHSIARKLITHHSRQKSRSKNLKFNISKEKSPSGAKV